MNILHFYGGMRRCKIDTNAEAPGFILQLATCPQFTLLNTALYIPKGICRFSRQTDIIQKHIFTSGTQDIIMTAAIIGTLGMFPQSSQNDIIIQ